MRQWGFVYLADGCDPARDVSRVDTGACLTVLVGVGEVEQVVAAAERLVAEGAQLIELCGAFGPVWTARVIDAVGARVPVGSVMYGGEATKQLHDLFGLGA
ncbi:DUF6506 family protein [Amycolatopsis umgeniensis]|uniref:Uncharacterized protein n=1 Tax=Amycolatopsis umgeniensis TaxID=336628 RepID=A0A841AX94_9PSEU|nr:DUF6506 family protein [Amycolatopsis umgeniensis]MBB5850982.1 hypothetical protein [Amycolatopsis umgeniensis]